MQVNEYQKAACPLCRKKYGNTNGSYQEQEDDPLLQSLPLCQSAVENHLSLDKVNKVKKKPVSILTLHKEYGIVI